MLAHHQSGLLNAAQFAQGLGVDCKTVARYLDLLVDLPLVRRLPSWQRNVGKRLVRAPKVYVRDSGIVHALLGLRDRETLLGHPVWSGQAGKASSSRRCWRQPHRKPKPAFTEPLVGLKSTSCFIGQATAGGL